MANASLIAVVDDDESPRESLENLLTSLGYAVEVFSSAEGFLHSDALAKADCLILDVHMPGISGPDLQRELNRRGLKIPIVFITAHRDERVISRIMTDGAIACLLKPYGVDSLLNGIRQALAEGRR